MDASAAAALHKLYRPLGFWTIELQFREHNLCDGFFKICQLMKCTIDEAKDVMGEHPKIWVIMASLMAAYWWYM